jgi:hypothetical protein
MRWAADTMVGRASIFSFHPFTGWCGARSGEKKKIWVVAGTLYRVAKRHKVPATTQNSFPFCPFSSAMGAKKHPKREGKEIFGDVLCHFMAQNISTPLVSRSVGEL